MLYSDCHKTDLKYEFSLEPKLIILKSYEEPNSIFGGIVASELKALDYGEFISDPCCWLFKIELEGK